MGAAIIFVISLAMLAQFFVAYCCSLLAAYAKIEVSAQAFRMAGLGSGDARAEEFHRLFQLVRLCPETRAMMAWNCAPSAPTTAS